jgi:very-short-patch-repair endonuclease
MSRAVRLGATSAAEVIDSTARCVSRWEQLEMVDAALNMGLMLEGDIGGLRLTPARTRRWLARHCDGRSQSLLETRTRVALRAAGLQVQPQVQIPGVGRVDFLIDGKVVVETDGRGTHALSAAFDTDRRRDRAALIAGYRVMRFGFSDVMGDIDGVVQQVVAVVRASRTVSR